MGASSHSETTRQKHDFYATDPVAIELLLKLEKFQKNIWECACGKGHLSKVLEAKKHNVKSTDLINRNYGTGGVNFLTQKEIFKGDIITNPPYKYANEFILHALNLVEKKSKVAMFLPVRFLSGKKRAEIFKKFPPKIIYVSSTRINCAKNGNFKNEESGAMDYAWFIWEKGFSGNTQTKWFN